MNRDSWLILCLAYLVGLLTTGLFYFEHPNLRFFIVFSSLIVTTFVIIVFRYFKGSVVDRKIWVIAALISFIAIAYFYLRIPQPNSNDISHLVTSDQSQLVEVRGTVLTEPRLNSNNKLRFWLQVSRVKLENERFSQSKTGKLYMTIPLLAGNNIYPRDLVTIKGALYKPKIPLDKTQFNFARYLQETGTFAGLTGFEVMKIPNSHQWGWYRLRQRIVRAQVQGLGSPWGQLVSSIVLGRKAVDLPDNIRGSFVKSGLAHILAASGFHVSLLLGFVLKITDRLDSQKRFIIGVATLLIYSFLTGFSPSILRASLMGIAVLIAISTEAKVRPLGALLLAAIIILLINPLWIWNLSFQLSFLATLGLIIALPNIESKLDFLPSNIANAIAIPLAASIWVLPLISYVFNTIPTYSILVNVLTTPLVTIICLGGMISSVISLIFPALGSSVAWLLKYPLLCLFEIVDFFANLPGSNWAVGNIPLWLLFLIYGVIITLCFNRYWQKKWWLLVTFILMLVLIPPYYRQQNLLQVTILDTAYQPSIVIRDRDRTILINKGNSQAIKYQILPFLAYQGINHLDYLVLDAKLEQQDRQTIKLLQSQVTINNLAFYSNTVDLDRNYIQQFSPKINPTLTTNFVTINPFTQNNALQLKINNQQWLITDNLASIDSEILNLHNVLIWWGNKLEPDELNKFKGKMVVGKNISVSFQDSFSTQQIYTMENDGAVTWTPTKGFISAREETLIK